MSLTSARSPSLNIDVLLNVMQFCDKTTICRLMQLSHQLYHHGAKWIIPRVVILLRESDYESFIAFMSAEAPYRFKFLHRIVFVRHPSSERVISLLADFLVRFEPVLKLRYCSIPLAENFFGADPALANAFAGLRSISSLDLNCMGPVSASYLRTFKAPLQRAALLMDPPYSTETRREQDTEAQEDHAGDHGAEGEAAQLNARETWFRNPIDLLRSCRRTLRALFATQCNTGPPDIQYTVQFPLLTSLTLEDNELPVTRRYVRAFPNLRSLAITTANNEVNQFAQSPDIFIQRHYMNEAMQLQNGSWDALEVVRGRLCDHYLLALTCPVKRLVIRGNWLVPAFLQTILQRTRPPYMYLECFDVNVFDTGLFGEALRGPDVACVRSLDISLLLGLSVLPRLINIAQSLDKLIDGLADLSIHTLGLSICCGVLDRGPLPDEESLLDQLGPPDGQPCAAEEYLAALDLDALAQRLQDAAPSIRTVVVTLAEHRTRPAVTVAQGAEEALALGKDAVEAIPLALGETLRKSWGRNARLFKALQEVSDFVEGVRAGQESGGGDGQGQESAVVAGP